MSRLESAIRRLMAQKAALDWAAAQVAARPGPVLELGLGNGRTYDHLREILPGRDIYVFEREVAAHPDCVPDDDHLFLGDVLEALPAAAGRLGPSAVLAHVDIGNGDKAASVALGKRMAPLLAPLLAPGAIVVSDQPLNLATSETLPTPAGVKPGRIHLQRFGAGDRQQIRPAAEIPDHDRGVRYRRSVAEDAEAVYALMSASVGRLAPDPYAPEVVRTWMAGRTVADYRADCANGEIWIAEAGETPIGFAHGVPGEVKRLFVDARHAGKGAGARLMERALRDALPGGGGTVKIDATLNAVPFYRRWGFEEVGRSVFPGRDESLPQIDVVVLEKRF